MDFNEDQIQRYARHILLNDVGGIGQEKILNARVLLVGAGGLGSPLALYLAAAGVGTLGIIDDDVVDLSNLQRQIAHATADVGRPKVESARDAILAINPDITVNAIQARLGPDNIAEILKDYDIVADGSDNFATRFLINDACYFARKTLVSGAILRFDGQIATYRPFPVEGPDGEVEAGPCYRCLFREPPPEGLVPTCAEAGVLGALCGVVGSLQASEVLKEIIGIGESLAGSLLIYDGLNATFRKVKVKPDPACPLCGDEPTIQDLSLHVS